MAVALGRPGAAAKEVTLLNMRSQQAGAELGGVYGFVAMGTGLL